jgi:hypothetical protein
LFVQVQLAQKIQSRGHVKMFGSQYLLGNCEGSFQQRRGFRTVAPFDVQLRQIAQSDRHLGVIPPEAAFANGERPIEEIFRLGGPVAVVEKSTQIVQTLRDIGVIRAEEFFPETKGPP